MTETQTPRPVQVKADDMLAALDQVVISIVQGNRVDLARLRSLPKWRALMCARLAYKAGTLPRAELDRISHEATFGEVKPAKTPPGQAPFAARSIVLQLADLWKVPDDIRERTNDTAERFVARMISEWALPREDEVACAISDPGTVVSRKEGETVSRWSARAVVRVMHRRLTR